jgi:hypothetical protein
VLAIRAMLALLCVAARLPSPPLRAMAAVALGRNRKAGSPIEPESRNHGAMSCTRVSRSGLSATSGIGVRSSKESSAAQSPPGEEYFDIFSLPGSSVVINQVDRLSPAKQTVSYRKCSWIQDVWETLASSSDATNDPSSLRHQLNYRSPHGIFITRQACSSGTCAGRLAPKRPFKPDTVPVTIEVEPAAAAVLDDDEKRVWLGRIVSRMLEPASVDRLFEVMDAISAEARRRGLTDEILEAELAAYNAERRDRPPSA